MQSAFLSFVLSVFARVDVDLRLFTIYRVHPATRHVDRFGPPLVQSGALGFRNVRGESRPVGTVHVFKFRVVLPDINGEPSRNGGAKSRGFVHGRTLHGHLDKVGLGLSNRLS